MPKRSRAIVRPDNVVDDASVPSELWWYVGITGAIMVVLLTGLVVLDNAGILGSL